MTDLKQFRENSIKRSLCEGYTDKWSEHKTKRELFELACDSNAVSYMAQSISEGWDFLHNTYQRNLSHL